MKHTKKILILVSMAIIGLTTNVQAALQSRPDTSRLVNTTANDFFKKIRNMEAEGGTLGLKAQINTTTYLDSTNNGVDVHMAKNTEWGTAAMLAASSYGTAPSGSSSATTTGNATGVYQMADSSGFEYVAGIYNTTNTYMNAIKGADARYYNLYTSETSIPGDATLETRNWKGASHAYFVNASYPVFLRSYYALFGYCYSNGCANSNYGSRACLVVGAGL